MKTKIRNTECKEKRIGSLITAVVLFVISALMVGFSFGFTQMDQPNGAEAIALIVTLPLLLVYFIVTIISSFASVFAGIATATSLNKSFRITGIVFTILSVALLALSIFTAVRSFSMI